MSYTASLKDPRRCLSQPYKCLSACGPCGAGAGTVVCMRSLLSSSAVALIGLLSSVATLGQLSASRSARRVYRFAAEHPRVPALMAAAVVAAATLVQWGSVLLQGMMQDSHGMFGFVGLIMRVGPSVLPAVILLAAGWVARRPPLLIGQDRLSACRAACPSKCARLRSYCMSQSPAWASPFINFRLAPAPRVLKITLQRGIR
jgi:hypothetical protein